MTPIHQLLNRIRWDKTFGSGRFEIGYFDRLENVIHHVAMQEINLPEDRNRVFELVDDTGETRRIPFHRIREVWKDGAIIWQRSSTVHPS